jgi:hypothetical protein
MDLPQPVEIHESTRKILDDMYRANKLRGTESDQPVSIDKITRTNFVQGSVMHNLMRSHSVRRSLEVGVAYGFFNTLDA